MSNHSTLKIDPSVLVFSPWNVNSVGPENQRKIEESIKRNGIFRPVIVRELETGELQVIAGEHTTRAAISLGYEEIDIYNLGLISEQRAKEISVIDNQHYGHEDALGLADLLREFDGDPETYLPFTDQDLKAIFKSSAIDFDELEMPEPSRVGEEIARPEDEFAAAPITHTFMRFKVPIGDAEFVQRCVEAVIRRQSITGGDSLANAGDALVYLCNHQEKE